MLLANMAVARHITDKFRDIAILRRHPPPQTRMIDELVSVVSYHIVKGQGFVSPVGTDLWRVQMPSPSKPQLSLGTNKC